MPTQPPLGKAHHPKLPKITTQRVEPGCQPESVYEAALNPVREAFRRAIVRAMPDESARIARWQQALRTPQRDTFFFWSAIFGSECLHVFAPVAAQQHQTTSKGASDGFERKGGQGANRTLLAHTFFTAFLPMLFFLGLPEKGRGYVDNTVHGKRDCIDPVQVVACCRPWHLRVLRREGLGVHPAPVRAASNQAV